MPQQHMTELQRLGGIVVSPAQTFMDINRRPSWLLPIVLLLVFNLVGDFIVFRVLVTDANFDQVAREKIQWDAQASGRQESVVSVEHQLDLLHRQRDRWYLLPFVAVPLTVLPLTLFFYVILLLSRAGASFLRVFSVVCWSVVIYRCIGGVVTIFALLLRGPSRFFPGAPEAWSPTSLAQVISRASVSPNIYSAVSKLDIFLVWWLAVMAIGFAKVSRNLSVTRAALIVGASEVLYLALNATGIMAGVL